MRTILALTLSVLLGIGPTRAQDVSTPQPSGLPPLTRVASPQQIDLGRRLFFDKRLSRDGSISCASCHQPSHAFSDPGPVSHGVGKAAGTRHAPTLLNVDFNSSFFWDGRRNTLEDQAQDPILNPIEQGLPEASAVVHVVKHDRSYVAAFKTAYGLSAHAITLPTISMALADFERSLRAANTPFDRYYYQHDRTGMSAAALRGLALFTGRAQCSTCHSLTPQYALLTDGQYHSLGVGMLKITPRLPEITSRFVAAKEKGVPIDHSVISDQDIAELGRFVVTLNPADIGKFRTPSLRNVELTSPYMHDGSVPSLAAAVELEIYYRSAEGGAPLILTPTEKSDLVAFLRSLTSPDAARLAASIAPDAAAPVPLQHAGFHAKTTAHSQ